jgi:hypothetical protein
MGHPINKTKPNHIPISLLRTPIARSRSPHSEMEYSIFSPTGLVLVARNTQSLIQFCRGYLDSPDETDLDTVHQTELTTPCKRFPHFNLQVRTQFCVDPEPVGHLLNS